MSDDIQWNNMPLPLSHWMENNPMGRSRTASKTQLPRGLNFGEPLLLTFDHPSMASGPFRSYLQDQGPDGHLYIDAPTGLSPAPGTPVLISSRNRNSGNIRFASKVLGRKRLHGRIPVLFINPPTKVERRQRRASYRIATGLRTELSWQTFSPKAADHSQAGIIANLSGGGAKLLLRRLPGAERLSISLDPAQDFVEEWAQRQLARANSQGRNFPLDGLEQICAKIRADFANMEVRPVHSRVQSVDKRGPIHALSVAFTQPQEGCFRLVSYLERHSLKRGLAAPSLTLPHAA